MTPKPFPVIAVTGSRLLRAELRTVEQQAGYEFEYADSVPQSRRYASRRPLIVIGSDLVTRFRNRLACRGIVVVASVNLPDARVWVHAERVGATYVIVLPAASSWLVHHLLRDLP